MRSPCLRGLAARSACQCGQERRGTVSNEPHTAIGEQKIRPVAVQAPEMVNVARIVELAGCERISAGRARPRRDPHDVLLAHAQNHVARASEALAGAGVPPAKLKVRTRWALAHQERIAQPVADIGDTYTRVAKKDTVSSGEIQPLDSEIARQRYHSIIADGNLRLLATAVRRADVQHNDGGVARMGRVIRGVPRLAVRSNRGVPKRLLLDVRQNLGKPAGKQHGVLALLPAHPRGKYLFGVVVQVQRQADLLQVIRALCPRGSGADALHRRQQQGDQYANNTNHHQKLKQGQGATTGTHVNLSSAHLAVRLLRHASSANGNGQHPKFSTIGDREPKGFVEFNSVPYAHRNPYHTRSVGRNPKWPILLRTEAADGASTKLTNNHVDQNILVAGIVNTEVQELVIANHDIANITHGLVNRQIVR
jgi:hypothetical protein